MSKNRSTSKIIANSLADLATTINQWQSFTGGGSTLSTYATIQGDNNYALLTLNWIVLSYLFAGNGIFQRVIRLPVCDALSKGFEIDSDEASKEDIDKVFKWFRKYKLFSNTRQFLIWKRLFGGSALIINTNQNPEEELNIKELKNGPLRFYAVDRWQLSSTKMPFDYLDNISYDVGDLEHFFIFGRKIHKSRVLIGRGEEAPHYLARQLRGWGMSEGERIIRDLNLYLKTQDVLYEILDESKIDVYYIQGLANKLSTVGGTRTIQTRIQAVNEIKSYLNALLLDAQDKFDQKSLSFAGLAEVMNQNRMGIAAAINFPMTKLFGMSAAGFNSGEDDLENYNSMVESEIREPLKYDTLPILIDMAFQIVHGDVPQYEITFPPLRIMSAEQEEQIATSKTQRIWGWYDRGAIGMDKAVSWGQKEGIIGIDVGYVPEKPEPNFQEGVDQEQQNTVSVYRKKQQTPEVPDMPNSKVKKFFNNIFNKEK